MKKYILFASLLSLLIGILGIKGVTCFDRQSAQIESQTTFNESEQPLAVTVTAYSPTEEECDEDPYVTAYQRPVKEGTIAISRDMEEEFGWHLGDRVHLKDLGVFEVWDRMHPRWKKKVDIFFHDTEKAVSFGVKHARVLKVEKRERNGV